MDIEDALKILRTDEHTFFRIAHQAMFGTMPDLRREVIEFKVAGIVPLYAQRYLKENEYALQEMQRANRGR